MNPTDDHEFWNDLGLDLEDPVYRRNFLAALDAIIGPVDPHAS